MNVVILQGSPRKGGNTDLVCTHVAEALTATGHEVGTLRLGEMTVGGCIECFACQGDADAPGCPVKDDMPTVYDAVLAADAIVLATPVFCWGMTAQLKAPVDRFFALCKFESPESMDYKVLIEGKRVALVVTAGGGPHDGAETVVASHRAMAQFMRLDNRGELCAAPLGQPEATRADAALKDRAAAFARRIVA